VFYACHCQEQPQLQQWCARVGSLTNYRLQKLQSHLSYGVAYVQEFVVLSDWKRFEVVASWEIICHANTDVISFGNVQLLSWASLVSPSPEVCKPLWRTIVLTRLKGYQNRAFERIDRKLLLNYVCSLYFISTSHINMTNAPKGEMKVRHCCSPIHGWLIHHPAVCDTILRQYGVLHKSFCDSKCGSKHVHLLQAGFFYDTKQAARSMLRLSSGKVSQLGGFEKSRKRLIFFPACVA
jgi:hypothetical protein